jgi:hypothetical protein
MTNQLMSAFKQFIIWLILTSNIAMAQPKISESYFGIRVVDEQTDRGIPLVELRLVNDVAYCTDSAGWIAFNEPGLMNREVFFAVSSPGFEYPKDGFGFRGVRLTTKPGTTATVQVKRTNIAERMYRLTGEGIYRDSTLLGLPTPNPEPNLSAEVLGQDSVQTVPYRGKLFWLWGDTNVARYPLGNFHTTAALTALPNQDGCRPKSGISFTYFRDPNHPDRLRRMVPRTEPGVVWLFGLLVVPDDHNNEALVAHFTRRKSLTEELEHGLVRFDDEAGIFKTIAKLDLKDTWRFPRGNAVRINDADGEYFYFAAPLCHTRVKAHWSAVIDPGQYEALVFDSAPHAYKWRRDGSPTTQTDELKLIKDGKLSKDRAQYQIMDASTGKLVLIHGASVAWNEYRQRWVLIGVQHADRDSPSMLGEIWYAESKSATGPWNTAVRIASHPNYSFYNPRHHVFFDEDKGRFIYFEGTYTKSFSGNPTATPRYDYNQILYRLDLSDSRLVPAQIH